MLIKEIKQIHPNVLQALIKALNKEAKDIYQDGRTDTAILNGLFIHSDDSHPMLSSLRLNGHVHLVWSDGARSSDWDGDGIRYYGSCPGFTFDCSLESAIGANEVSVVKETESLVIYETPFVELGDKVSDKKAKELDRLFLELKQAKRTWPSDKGALNQFGTEFELEENEEYQDKAGNSYVHMSDKKGNKHWVEVRPMRVAQLKPHMLEQFPEDQREYLKNMVMPIATTMSGIRWLDQHVYFDHLKDTLNTDRVASVEQKEEAIETDVVQQVLGFSKIGLDTKKIKQVCDTANIKVSREEIGSILTIDSTLTMLATKHGKGTVDAVQRARANTQNMTN